MQKRISLFLCLAVILGMLSGCASAPAADENRLSIVTTIFPEYDWVRQILGTKADSAALTLLLDNGVDLHSYRPTADDMVKISTCDLFIYAGGASDGWVEDALREAVSQKTVVMNLLDVLGGAVKEEELVEGMQDEDDEDEDADAVEYDEHVWLSLRNAAVKTVLFGDRFPFRYLVDDYGLGYYAAFAGCSAETEASFDTIIFPAGKVDELGLNAVLTIESGDGKIAQTIVENTAAKSAQILRMDSMQSTTARNVADGATYLGAMERNLEVLEEALR